MFDSTHSSVSDGSNGSLVRGQDSSGLGDINGSRGSGGLGGSCGSSLLGTELLFGSGSLSSLGLLGN